MLKFFKKLFKSENLNGLAQGMNAAHVGMFLF
jgi:hypothetical protein